MSDNGVETVGLVSDIHANAVALEAVLEDMPPVDALVSAGDYIGYGPSPNECLELLRAREAIGVRGNHDEALFGGPVYESGDQYAIDEISAENERWIRNHPAELTVFDGRVKIVHGNPRERFRYTYPTGFEPDLLESETVLILGHTHTQAKAAFGAGIVVNPGSVGQPRDEDEQAAYAVADLTEPSVTLHRVAYDINEVCQKIQQTPISSRNCRRLRSGR